MASFPTHPFSIVMAVSRVASIEVRQPSHPATVPTHYVRDTVHRQCTQCGRLAYGSTMWIRNGSIHELSVDASFIGTAQQGQTHDTPIG
jgi:hypothetical protein